MDPWKSDEQLGDRATIANILYANINYKSLREDYPNWKERLVQIQKVWNMVPKHTRSDYQKKALQNRIANRRANFQANQVSAPEVSPLNFFVYRTIFP